MLNALLLRATALRDCAQYPASSGTPFPCAGPYLQGIVATNVVLDWRRSPTQYPLVAAAPNGAGGSRKSSALYDGRRCDFSSKCN